MKKLALIILSAGLLATAVFTFPSPSLATTKCFTYDPGGTLTTSLVSYYPMEGNSNDFWGSNNGTDTSVSYGTSYGKVNEGVGFSGSSGSYIDIPNAASLNPTSALSISVWIKVSGSSEQNIINKGNDSFYLAVDGGNSGSGKVTFYINSVFSGWLVSSATVSDGTWHHIVAEYNGSVATIYVDNVSSATHSYTGSIPTGTTDIQMGIRVGNNGYFNGDLDEVGIWSKALSSTEVSNLYNSGSGQTMTTSCGGAPVMSWTTIMMF